MREERRETELTQPEREHLENVIAQDDILDERRQTPQTPDRLKLCFEAGSAAALFPILTEWPESELRGLLGDIDRYHERSQEILDAAWKEAAMEPGNFFNASSAQRLDQDYVDAGVELLGMLAEISSVALFYLPDEESGPEGHDFV